MNKQNSKYELFLSISDDFLFNSQKGWLKAHGHIGWRKMKVESLEVDYFWYGANILQTVLQRITKLLWW